MNMSGSHLVMTCILGVRFHLARSVLFHSPAPTTGSTLVLLLDSVLMCIILLSVRFV